MELWEDEKKTPNAFNLILTRKRDLTVVVAKQRKKKDNNFYLSHINLLAVKLTWQRENIFSAGKLIRI